MGAVEGSHNPRLSLGDTFSVWWREETTTCIIAPIIPAIGSLNIDLQEAVFASIIGTVHVISIFAIFSDDVGVSGVDDLLILGYLVVGIFLLGAIPAILLRKNVFLPMVVLVCLFLVNIFGELQAQRQPVVALPPTPIVLYTFGWIVLLPILYGIGGIETLVKRRITEPAEDS